MFQRYKAAGDNQWLNPEFQFPVGQLCDHARPQRGRVGGFCVADRDEASGGAFHRIHAL